MGNIQYFTVIFNFFHDVKFCLCVITGWHREFNAKAKEDVPFYLLVSLLFDEAKLAEIDRNLIREDLLTERNHPIYKRVNETLFSLWKVFKKGDLSASELLRKCSKLYGPTSL